MWYYDDDDDCYEIVNPLEQMMRAMLLRRMLCGDPMYVDEEADRPSLLQIEDARKAKRSGLSNFSFKSLVPFDHFCNDSRFSDITLVVGEHSFQAHRIILSAWSDVFKSSLTSGVKVVVDKGHCSSGSLQLQEDDDCCEVFDQFLAFMYNEKLQITESNFFPLLKLSHKYRIQALEELCCKYVEDLKKDVPSTIALLERAAHFGMEDITESCLSIIRTNFEIVTSEQLQKLDGLTLVKLLEGDEKLVVSDEFSVFQKLEPWLRDCTDQHVFMSVIKGIRFLFMSAGQLMKVASSDVTKRILEVNTTFITDAFQQHALYRESFFSELSGSVPLLRLYLDKVGGIPDRRSHDTGRKSDERSFLSLRMMHSGAELVRNVISEVQSQDKPRKEAHFYEYDDIGHWIIEMVDATEGNGNDNSSTNRKGKIRVKLHQKIPGLEMKIAEVGVQAKFEDGFSQFMVARKPLFLQVGLRGTPFELEFELADSTPAGTPIRSCQIRVVVIIHG